MRSMIGRNLGAFAMNPVGPPPPTLGVQHAIHLQAGHERPIKQPPYRHSAPKHEWIDSNVVKLLQHNLCRLSNSPWSSPIVIVYKHDGSPRMCIDYRRLNSATLKDAYPMPLIEDCLAACREANFLSIVDVQDAYYHIEMEESSKPLTAFVTSQGLFEWNVMPFGLSNAPATFQRHVDTVLRSLLRKKCVAFFDDIVVFTRGSFEQHVLDVEAVLQLLAGAHLSAKVKKCKFGYKEIIFVGHLIREGRLYPDPSKLESIRDFPLPTNLSSLKSFIGLCNYYRRFIAHFVRLARPLYALQKKGVEWHWGEAEQAAFDALKLALLDPACLRAPDPKRPFILHTDASGLGLGAVLVQVSDDGEEHPCGFISCQLDAAQQNYTTSELECLAVVWAVQQFEPFLIDSHFTLVTDHEPLVWLPTKNFANKRLLRWAMRLGEYSFTVKHRKGRNNANADALSRSPLLCAPPASADLPPTLPPHISAVRSGCAPRYCIAAAARALSLPALDTDSVQPEHAAAPPHSGSSSGEAPNPVQAARSASMAFIEIVDSDALTDIIAAQHADATLRPIIAWLDKREVPANFSESARTRLMRSADAFYMLSRETEPPALYRIAGRTRGMDLPSRPVPELRRLVVPAACQPALLEMYHSSPFGGHLGVSHTYHKLAVLYYWERMLPAVDDYVAQCRVCQQQKVRRHTPAHLQLRMAHPARPFNIVSMDFIEMTRSHDFAYVLTFIDHFTKFAVAVPCVRQDSRTAASILVNELCCRYGAPEVLLSDNGSAFDNAMCAGVYSLLRIEKRYSTAYRAQANGQIERFNGTLKQILRSLCDLDPTQWLELLQPAVFAYNTSINESTGMSPFYALFGREARAPFFPTSQLFEPLPASAQPVLDYSQDLQLNLERASQWIHTTYAERSAAQHAHNLNLQRIPVFAPGDLVYMRHPAKLNYKSSAASKVDQWLPHPYEVLARSGDVIYSVRAVDRCTGLKFGKVFKAHVSTLKKFMEQTPAQLRAKAARIDISAPAALQSMPFHAPSTMPDYEHEEFDTAALRAAQSAATSGATPRLPQASYPPHMPSEEQLRAQSDALSDVQSEGARSASPTAAHPSRAESSSPLDAELFSASSAAAARLPSHSSARAKSARPAPADAAAASAAEPDSIGERASKRARLHSLPPGALSESRLQQEPIAAHHLLYSQPPRAPPSSAQPSSKAKRRTRK